MPDGRFLKTLRAAKPYIPTIAFVRPGNSTQEVAARALGVSAVLTEDASDETFRDTVANLLGLKGAVVIKAISPAENTKELMRER
jgi:hypothetical protein